MYVSAAGTASALKYPLYAGRRVSGDAAGINGTISVKPH